MEIAIRFFGEEQLFLEIIFIGIQVLEYHVIVDPVTAPIQKMKEEETKKYADREYRFLSIAASDFSYLVKNNCKIRVIAEDDDGRTLYSNILDLGNGMDYN